MKIRMACALATAALAASAADFNVRDYGAKGDGETKDTVAIQSAIDACAGRGGGRVVIDDGTFLSGAIALRSGVELHLGRTARLLASPDIADFPDWPDARHVVKDNLPRQRNAAFIFADEAERIAITGGGTIDCNGKFHIRESAFDGRGTMVSGTLKPTAGTISGVTLANGATLDLSDRSDAFSLDENAISFANGASISISLGSRNVSSKTPLVSWTTAPSNVGTLTFLKCADGCRLAVKDDGVYPSPKGMMIIVR